MGAALPRRLFMTHGPASSQALCLTFDDGPHPEYTPRLLRLLSELGVPATFFLVGQEAERFPAIVRQIVEEGHVVGNHTFEHRDATMISSGSYLADVLRAKTLLGKLTGHKVDLFRPPHGRLTIPTLWGLWQAGQRVVLCNVDSKDYSRPGPVQILDEFDNCPLRAGDILLFHDNRPHCLTVLPDLIQKARARSLTFTTPEKWMN
jgi:peptidoglycan-N-acetylglucosamine deacetylase